MYNILNWKIEIRDQLCSSCLIMLIIWVPGIWSDTFKWHLYLKDIASVTALELVDCYGQYDPQSASQFLALFQVRSILYYLIERNKCFTRYKPKSASQFLALFKVRSILYFIMGTNYYCTQNDPKSETIFIVMHVFHLF